MREDAGSRPYAWLRPDFIPPSPFLVVNDPGQGSSRFLVEPHLIDAEFRKAWLPFFCRSGHPVVTVDQFLSFVPPVLPQEAELDLPLISGRELLEVAKAKKSTAGGLDGWAWNEIKALPLSWFSGLAILLNLVESTCCWPQGLLDAYIAMIPKTDGGSTSSECASCCLQVMGFPQAWSSEGMGAWLGSSVCVKFGEWAVVCRGMVFCCFRC